MSIKMSTARKELGNLAENIAARYLEGRGYEILEKNYQKPWGEIDIIAARDNTCVFIEVKANSKNFFGDFNPELRVDRGKLSKILKTSKLYVTDNPKFNDWDWQVDVISVIFDKDGEKAKIKHFKNVVGDLY